MTESIFNRRDFLKVAGVGLSMRLLPGCSKTVSCERPPNIVLILADDLGYQELGCYGQRKIRTPNIDKMAIEGLRFTQNYAGAPVCAPSRCCLMTGKHAGNTYIRANSRQGDRGAFLGQLPLPYKEVTLAELLKEQGYNTGCFGKWGLGNTGTSGSPATQGFDRFYGYECQAHAHNLYPNYLMSDGKKETLSGNTRGITGEKYAPQLIADEMLEFIRQNKNNQFFAYYPTVLPHLALQVPEEDLNQYKGKWTEDPYTGENYDGSYLPHPTPKACYAAMISFLDKQIGRLFSTLKQLGIDNNTIVIFTSDNGTTWLKKQVDYEFFNSVGSLRGLKGSLYEGGIRVPLITRWPGKIKQNTTSDHIAANYDLLATITEIANCDRKQRGDGISFAPVLFGRSDQQKKHEYLFWDFPSYGGQLAVRMGKWKGVKQNLIENPNSPLELYDLQNDVAEKNNVAQRHPTIVAKIEKIMIEARKLPEVEKFQFGRYSESDHR